MLIRTNSNGKGWEKPPAGAFPVFGNGVFVSGANAYIVGYKSFPVLLNKISGMEPLTNTLKDNLIEEALEAGRLSIVPEILKTICLATGMGFAAVARVTPGRWIACGVQDNIQFGMRPGGELPVDTTICHEIRQSGKGVIIDEVADDEYYRAHHTPAAYGFQSYISLPIMRYDGTFFGTLCAIDPSAAVLNTPEVITLFKIYAELISLHLNAKDQLPTEKVAALEKQSVAVLQTQLSNLTTLLTPAVLKDKRGDAYNHILQNLSARITALIADLRK